MKPMGLLELYKDIFKEEGMDTYITHTSSRGVKKRGPGRARAREVEWIHSIRIVWYG